MQNKDTNVAVAEETVTAPTKSITKWKLGVFGGHYGRSQASVYNMFKACGVPAKLAFKYALDWGSRYGQALIEERDDAAVKTKKADASGNFTSKVSGQFKAKDAVFALHYMACRADELVTQKLITKRFMPPRDSYSELVDSYITKSEKWVAEQEWDEESLNAAK